MTKKENTVFDYLVQIKKNLYAGMPIKEEKEAIEKLVQNNPYREYYIKVIETTEQWSDILRIEGNFSKEYANIKANFAEQGIYVALEEGKNSCIIFVW